MKHLCRNLVLALVVAISYAASGGAASRDEGKNDVVLSTMQQELQRAQLNLGKLDPAPYFLSYSVYDESLEFAVGSRGTLLSSVHGRRRSADVVVRVGTPTLDNSHEQGRVSAISSGLLPLDDDHDALSRELWRLSYEEYRKSARTFLNIKTGQTGTC